MVAHRGNRRYPATYGDLALVAGRFAAELQRREIPSGERVVLWGANSAEWIGFFFGCLLRGVIVVPLDAAGSADFANKVVNDVAPRLIVGDAHLLHSLDTGTPQIAFSEAESKLPQGPLFGVNEAVTQDTPFQIVFTSGTTSEPKGIVHTHRNVLASLQPIEDEIAKYRKYERFVHPLRFLHTLPLSHVFGQFMGLWIPPLLSAEVHFGEQLEAARLTELIHRERISVLVAVPRVLELLRAHLLARFDSLPQQITQAEGLSLWKRWWRFRSIHRALGWKFWAVISGGASLPAELESFWNTLGFALIQGYGMTETAALVTLNHPFRIGTGTIGKALPGREVRISNEGEILVRGDMLAKATWQRGAMHPREGEWLATGDLASESDSGELHFLGRKGDVIVTSAGMNIHPADLEQAMKHQPGVRGCVVVPCEMAGGAEPVAIALFSGSEEQLQQVVAQANRTLSSYQQIRRVLQWPDLQFPFTSTGNLLRRHVAQWACAKLSNQVSTSVQSRDALVNLIAQVTGEPIAQEDDRLRLSEDMHLDSLGRVQLQSTLEQTLGLELEDDAIATVETLGDLRSLLKQSIPTEGPPFMEECTDQTSVEMPATAVRQRIESAQVRRETPSENTYPHWPWRWPLRAIRVAFLELIMRPLIWLLAAPKVERCAEPLPAEPLLVIANHVTAYDGALVLYALPAKLRRKVAVAMSGEMLLDLRHGRNQGNALLNVLAPPAYWLLTALFNVFPLPRQYGFRRSFAHAGEAMDHGYSVLIFPEGTRSPDGKLHSFRKGIGLLAEQSRAPVLPVALLGLGEMRVAGSRWFRSGKLAIYLGEVIPVDEGARPAELTARYEDSLRHLLAESSTERSRTNQPNVH